MEILTTDQLNRLMQLALWKQPLPEGATPREREVYANMLREFAESVEDGQMPWIPGE